MMKMKLLRMGLIVVAVISCFELGRALADNCTMTCDNVNCAKAGDGNIYVWTKPAIGGASVSYCYANMATVPPQAGGTCTKQINPATGKAYQVWQYKASGQDNCVDHGAPKEYGTCSFTGTATTVDWYQCKPS